MKSISELKAMRKVYLRRFSFCGRWLAKICSLPYNSTGDQIKDNFIFQSDKCKMGVGSYITINNMIKIALNPV